MSASNLTYKSFGEKAVLIEWPSKIDKETLNDVIFFKNKILQNNNKEIVEVINTYNSITVIYRTTIKNIYNKVLALKSIYISSFSSFEVKNYCWKIPVCYDLEFGLDLQEIAKKNKLTLDAIINLHSSAIYTVYFIGFLPGFLYLGGLDKRLFFDRKSTPRIQVKKGSVGIARSQTGIYPSQSSGGWNIIGRSPISFFDPKLEQPCFATSGDKIKFISISMEEYKQLKTQVEIGFYQLEKEIIHD